MRSTIVLSGDCRDAVEAARWAKGEARRARYDRTKAEELAGRVLKSYRAACEAFFGLDGSRQKLMICLDLGRPTPRFELISDGEQARGAVSTARGLDRAERRRAGLLDGLTCVAVPVTA